MSDRKKLPYEKPEVVRHGNLKEITMTSFTPPPPPGGGLEQRPRSAELG
jgi:hypothetical protein